jgi:dipeptidyl aminopeptidase/acylaminoacyl peptidase
LVTDIGSAGHFLAEQYPKWSPDGNRLAYIRSPEDPNDHSQELWMWSRDSGEQSKLTSLHGRINSFQWSPDGSQIAFAGDRYGKYDIWKVDISEDQTYRLTESNQYEVFPFWAPDGDHLLYVRMNDAWTAHNVMEIPSDGEGESRVIVEDRNFFDYEAGGEFGYPRVSPDGEHILFRSWRSGWLNYWLVPREGGEPRQIASADAEQSHARWSPNGDQIAYVENHNGTTKIRVVDADGGQPRTAVEPEGMGVVSKPEWSPSGDSLSFFYETPTSVRDLMAADVDSGSQTRLTSSTQQADVDVDLVEPEKISYESTDGHTISGYLYTPEEVDPENPRPGILWIHGGPTSQYMDTFQQHVQYFVKQGYVVLQPNIRGSSGYGKEFADANNGCWGHCDLEDVLAGKEYLGQTGYVDTSSVGITGTSYGGCMSMSAIAFAPNAFEAAVPQSGYGDWVHFMGEQELRHVKLLEHEFGTLEENRETYVDNSPIHDIEKVKTPTLLLHGEGYYPGSEASELFASELKRHYKIFDHKVYPNENYYVYGRENRRQLLLDMKSFMDDFLKSDFRDRS